MSAPRADLLRQVHAIDAERTKLETLGLRQARQTAVDARAAALRLAGAGPARVAQAVARVYLDKLTAGLADAQLAAYLTARRRTFLVAEPHLKRRTNLSLYDSALDVLRQRLDLSETQLAALRAKFGADAVNVTRGFADDVEARLREAMVRIVAQGETSAGGIPLLKEAMASAGVDADQPYLLETFFRTETQKAYAAARWQAASDPAIADVLWGWQYVAILDDRARPSHAAKDGMQAPKDDAIWHTWWPPNGFNCRCTTIELFGTNAVVMRGDGAPDLGFAFNSGLVQKAA